MHKEKTKGRRRAWWPSGKEAWSLTAGGGSIPHPTPPHPRSGFQRKPGAGRAMSKKRRRVEAEVSQLSVLVSLSWKATCAMEGEVLFPFPTARTLNSDTLGGGYGTCRMGCGDLAVDLTDWGGCGGLGGRG
jgi:hypothetical protein